MVDTGSYVYLVVRGLGDKDLEDLVGHDGAPARVVPSGDLAAVVSTVDLAEFGAEALRRNLENLDWLEEVARTHEFVINRVNEIATVAPMRLATILYDDTRVADLLDQWCTDLTATLDRVHGCREWSVKLIQEAQEASSGVGPDDVAEQESGTAYLQRRRSAQQQKAQRAEDAAALAEEVHRALADGTVASRRLPPQDRRLTGHQGEMTLNGAYLVRDEAGEGFACRTRELEAQHPHVRLEVGGPWPPYSFATLDSAGTP